MNVLHKSAFILLLLSLVMVVFPYSAASAASAPPTILSYQGRLANSGGILVGGTGTTYYFKFSLWDNATVGSGTKVWPAGTPATTTATVRQGVFNVNIGDTGNGYPDALNINFANYPQLYLQVEVSSDNNSSETLTPRQQLTSAIYAQVAGAVVGTNQSAFGTTTHAFNSAVTVAATSSNVSGLTIVGAASQTANLFQIQSNSFTTLLSISSAGALTTAASTTIGGVFNAVGGLSTLSNLFALGSSTVSGAFSSTLSNVLASTTLLGNTLLNNATTSTFAITGSSTISGMLNIGGALNANGGGAFAGTFSGAHAYSGTVTFSGGLVSNGSTTISGLTSGLVGNSNGLLYGFATSSLFGYTPLNPTRQITIAGTANQLTSSAGAQDLSADRTWTLSLPSHVIFPTDFVASAGSTTNATSTTFAITGTLSCSGANALNTTAGGNVVCGAVTAGGGAFPFTPFSATAVSTTSGLMIFASSTIGNGTVAGGLTVSGNSTTTGLAYFANSIGIGTSTLSLNNKLAIDGSDPTAISESISNINSAGFAALIFGNNTSNQAGGFYLAGSTQTAYGGPNSVNLVNALNAPIAFGTQGLVRVTIAGGGNVGVGSTSPFAKFAIAANNGDTNLTLFAIGSSTQSATSTLFSIANTGLTRFNIPNLTTGAFTIGTSTTAQPAFTISTQSGISVGALVGIATSSPWGKLAVEMGTFHPSFVVSNQGSSTPAFIVSGALQNGRIGVGSTTPFATFSIGIGGSGSLDESPFAVGKQGSSTLSLYVGSANQNGFVGIGTSTNFLASTSVLVVGSSAVGATGKTIAVFANAAGAAYLSNLGLAVASDERLKKNIEELPSVLNSVLALKPVKYNYTTEDNSVLAHIGFLAQQAQPIFPDLVGSNDQGYLSFNYGGLTPYLVSAIQAQQQELASSTATSTADAVLNGPFGVATGELRGALGSALNSIAGITQTGVRILGGAIHATVGAFDKVFAREVHTDKLCVGDTCVTQSQFLQMVQTANASSGAAEASAPSTPSAPATSDPAPSPAASSGDSATQAE